MPEVRVAPHPVCDFCSDPEPRYLEDCADFEALPYDATYHAQSTGAWAACTTCHSLIQARQWRQLERRAVDALTAKWPDIPKSRVQHGVQLIHAQFRAHKPVEGLNP